MGKITNKEDERRRRQAHIYMTIFRDLVVVELKIDGRVVWDYVGLRGNWHEVTLNVRRNDGKEQKETKK